MSVTIADVARRAGVGQGTVSRVLNNRPNVDPETRAKVQRAIEELEFVPSATARRLSLGRTQTIGVVVAHLTTSSVVERLRGIEGALAPAGYDMIVFNVETVERRDTVMREIARRERFDGALVVSIQPTPEEVSRIVRAGIPIVLLDVDHPGIPRVVVDDVAGGRLSVRHLLKLGHERIAFLGDPPRLALGFRSSQRRLRGVRTELAAAGFALPDGHVASGEHGRASAADLARQLLAGPDRPTAIVCASDTQAFGAIEAIRGLGLDVPGDISVVGYDDIELAAPLGLTTVRQPLEASGQLAVERLLAHIAGMPVRPARAVLPVLLVARDTTAPPPSVPKTT